MGKQKNVLFTVLALFILTIGLAYGQKSLMEVRVIAGNPNDFMMVRHVKIEGTNYQIGRAIAQLAQQDGIILRPSGDPFKNRVQTEYLKKNYHAFYERMRGAAAGYGVSLADYRYALSYLSQYQGAYGCSGVYYPPETTANGHGILSRNFDYGTGDFQYRTDGARVTARPIIFELYPDKGYPSIAICAYDLLGAVIDGINAQGLTVAIFADGTGDLSRGINVKEVGLHELAAMRYLLDNCATLDEAKDALLSLKHFVNYASCHYLIADHSGKSFIFEFSPDRRQVYFSDSKGVQYITNHLIYEGATPCNNDNSLYRIRVLRQAVEQARAASGSLDADGIEKINQKVANIYTGSITRTLWYSQYDTTAPKLRVRFYLGDIKNADGSVHCRYSDLVTLTFEKF